MNTYVLYHANCPDGFCSAYVARNALGSGVQFIPVQYGTEPPEVDSGSTVYILDFSYKRPIMLAWLERCRPAHVTILDHHKTAQAELQGLVSTPTTTIKQVFDMDKSGARLTWEWFFADKAPWLVRYVEDRDLWRWALPDSQEISAAIRTIPMTFKDWDRLWAIPTPDEMIPMGRAILAAERQTVARHVDQAREIELAGHKILVVNATTLTSEIAGELAAGRPFGACYFDRTDGKRVWSLRSRVDGIDVSEIARRFGGGGHRQAAGFEQALRIEWPGGAA